jgi:hypothetical protein
MNDEIRSLGSVRARGIILLLVVAVAAGVAGGAIDRAWVARDGGWSSARGDGVSIEHPIKPEPVTGASATRREEPVVRTDRSLEERRPPEERGGIPISLRSLDLNQDQRTRIEKISARYQPAAESVFRSIRDRVAELDLRMRQEAMCVLTPKQRDDWIAWRKRERVIVEEGDLMMKLVTTNACPK